MHQDVADHPCGVAEWGQAGGCREQPGAITPPGKAQAEACETYQWQDHVDRELS